ncbi:DNA-binding protein [Salmonella enterica]|uniref:DNA-binding protein n=1 Tax=Salmonella enterica TaxID=28901 RepID=UPI0009B02467|nr:DNA-binding protein [Salmonella enterica]
MIANKEWFTAQELANLGLPGFPKDKSGINRRANKEGWLRRQRANVRGVAYEFHISALPAEAQLVLGKPSDVTAAPIDMDLLEKLIESIEILLIKKQKKMEPREKAKIIAMLYKACLKSDIIDDEIISNIIELVA